MYPPTWFLLNSLQETIRLRSTRSGPTLQPARNFSPYRWVGVAALLLVSVSLFLFEERIGTLRRRAQQLGMDLDLHMQSGKVRVQQIDPAELSAGPWAPAQKAKVQPARRSNSQRKPGHEGD